jgi:hypothetical protein
MENFDSKIYTIANINYLNNQHKGIAKLSSSKRLIWSITEYPVETLGMPGSPYLIQVSYTLINKKYSNQHKRNFSSISGSFVYQISSGTLPHLSELGIPFGTYLSLGRSDNIEFNKKIMIILTENSSKLIIGL